MKDPEAIELEPVPWREPFVPDMLARMSLASRW